MTTEVLDALDPGVSAPWVPDDTTFGARLALIEQRMGWNVKEAAIACGIPPQSWRAWRQDKASPRNYPNVCRQIAERTGCDLVWLSGMIARQPMVRYEPTSRSGSRNASRPPDNRPSARPSSGGHGPDRRTVRLPRPAPRDGA